MVSSSTSVSFAQNAKNVYLVGVEPTTSCVLNRRSTDELQVRLLELWILAYVYIL